MSRVVPKGKSDVGTGASVTTATVNLSTAASPLREQKSRHVQLVDNDVYTVRERQWTSGTSRFHRPSPMVCSPTAYSAYSRAQSSGVGTPIDPHSPRASISTFHLQHLLENLEMDQYDTFGAEELRDGFFDATFYRSSTQLGDNENVEEEERFGLNLKRLCKDIFRVQMEDTKFFFVSAFGTRDGILLAKAFSGYFVAYIMCLIPQTQHFLGKSSYWVTIAALFNHSGRTVGAQIDGTIGCIVGGALGLAISWLALETANSTTASRQGYGSVLAAFLIPCIGVFSWIRCTLLRFYQSVITAGLAMLFLCLVETDEVGQSSWRGSVVRKFAVPWLIGLGICLVVNICLYPETGSRAVAYKHLICVFLSILLPNFMFSRTLTKQEAERGSMETTALHKAMCSALQGLVLPRTYSLEIHSSMGAHIVNLSDAVRDMKNEITFSSLKPDDVEQLRNTLQDVIRQIMAIKPETALFEHEQQNSTQGNTAIPSREEVVVQIEYDADAISIASSSGHENPLEVVHNIIAGPARDLIAAMRDVLNCCDNELMRLSWVSNLFDRRKIFDVKESQSKLRAAMKGFDEADNSLVGHPELPLSYSSYPRLVELFLFINPLRQAANPIDALATKTLDMSQAPKPRTKRLFMPSYSFRKAIYRTNPQVRHDRGGVSAGYYFRIKNEINDIMGKIHARVYYPDALARNGDGGKSDEKNRVISGTADERTMQYRIWIVLHRLQQFEARFALKVILVTGMLSIPAWLEKSRVWWLEYESWWAVVAAWLMMHPRVGGNAQDLVTRTIAIVVGAVWGGLANVAGTAAGSASPYVLAVFALTFMVPAVFRFILSSHPRSGLMSCLSFTIVSLSAYNHNGRHSSVEVAWSRGAALVVGVVAAVVVNWIVWPFVARRELRKSLSYMLLNLGIAYRGIVARYIYHDSDYHPTPGDIEMSQMQEAKLREYCFHMRELVEMTRHEIRIQGPFNPAPYSDAIDACERFLEHIIEVRQASLYFQPFLFQGSEEATQKMLSPRRDAVASILMNLYVLAAALRSKRPVPRYLPSAAAARKRLLDRMAEVEAEYEDERQVRPRPEKTRRWADVYHYAYAAALTDIVAQVELLERLTKVIIGEMALDAPDLNGF